MRTKIVLLASLCSCASAFAPAGAALLAVSRVRPGWSPVLSLRMQSSAKPGKKSTAREVLEYFDADLSGKTAVITGANSGIGLETVKALASVGCRVIAGVRNVEAGRAAIDSEVAQPGEGGYVVAEPEIEVRELDLSDLMSVERFARGMQDEQIDLLVNNAGIMALPSKEVTVQGFEKQIGVNHFGHFHLTNLLLPGMQAQGSPARIVTLSSVAHESFGEFDVDDLHYSAGRKYSAWGAYGQSKLANLLFTKALHSRLVAQRDCQISSLAVHPGVIRTALWREQAGWFNSLLLPFLQDKTIPQGAATTVYACVAPEFSDVMRAGAYLSDCKVAVPSAQARSQINWQALWLATEGQIAEAMPGQAIDAADADSNVGAAA